MHYKMVDAAIIEQALVISAAATAFCAITDEGEALSFWPPVADWLTPGRLKAFRKPLYACAKCQAGSVMLIVSLVQGYTLQALAGSLLAIFFALIWQRIIYAI